MIAIGVAALFIIPKLFQHATLQTGDLDTGNYSNLAWAIFHGEGFTGSALGRHHLGEHFSPIMVLVGLLYFLWSNAYVLMLLQGSSVAVAVLLTLKNAQGHLSPLPLWERVRVRGNAGIAPGAQLADNAAERSGNSPHPGPLPQGERGNDGHFVALLGVLFLFYPQLLATWKTQFQPIELGMPLAVLAIVLLHTRRDAWLGLVVLLLLMTRESAPLSVLGLAIYAGGLLRRWRLAMVLTAVAAVWAAVVFAWLMPHFRGGEHWAHERWVGPAELWSLKAKYLAIVFLGLGPLPFLGKAARVATLAAVPGVLLNLAVARETQVTFVGHYDAQIAPFLMVAAAHGVVHLFSRWRGTRHRWAGMGIALAMSIVCFALAGVRTPFEVLVRWWPDRTSLAAAREAREFGSAFANAPAFSATSRLGPQVCNRPKYMAMRCGTTSSTWAAWASQRLVPGEILLIPTETLDPDDVAERTLVRHSGRAELIRQGTYVEAWQWPADAPPPNTPAASDYVRAELKRKSKKR